MKNIIIWTSTLVLGAVLGWLGIEWLNALLGFIATVYTKCHYYNLKVIILEILTRTTSPSCLPGLHNFSPLYSSFLFMLLKRIIAVLSI
jgi:hypothetical protein